MWARGLLALLAVLLAGVSAAAEDRHAGYYYPEPQSSEVYTARVAALPETERGLRIGFVTGLTKQLVEGRYTPPYAIFAKGDQAEKLIIVGLIDNQLDTIYRARAVLANLTAAARVTPFFCDNAEVTEATFLDLLKLLGFQQLTISDGDSFAHQIAIE